MAGTAGQWMVKPGSILWKFQWIPPYPALKIEHLGPSLAVNASNNRVEGPVKLCCFLDFSSFMYLRLLLTVFILSIAQAMRYRRVGAQKRCGCPHVRPYMRHCISQSEYHIGWHEILIV